MRRYLLFGGALFDERRGIDDLIGQFDDLAAASDYARGYSFDGECWWHILDTHTGAVHWDDGSVGTIGGA